MMDSSAILEVLLLVIIDALGRPNMIQTAFLTTTINLKIVELFIDFTPSGHFGLELDMDQLSAIRYQEGLLYRARGYRKNNL